MTSTSLVGPMIAHLSVGESKKGEAEDCPFDWATFSFGTWKFLAFFFFFP